MKLKDRIERKIAMGRFVIRQTASGYKFDLRAANGENVATSEVYSSLAVCRKGLDSVIRCAQVAKLAYLPGGEYIPNPKFEVFRDKAGEYRFRLKARNGKVVAVSEGYQTKAACEDGAESVRINTVNAAIVFE